MKKILFIILWCTCSFLSVVAQDTAPVNPTAISPNFTWYKKIIAGDTSFYGYSNNNWVNFARREWVKKTIRDNLNDVIRNQVASQQTANFNINGVGRASIFEAPFFSATGEYGEFSAQLGPIRGEYRRTGVVLSKDYGANSDATFYNWREIGYTQLNGPGSYSQFLRPTDQILTSASYIYLPKTSGVDTLETKAFARLSYASNNNVVKLNGQSQVVTHAIRFDDFIRSQVGGSYSQLYGVEWQTGVGNKASLATGTSGDDIAFTANGAFIINTHGDNYEFSDNITRLGDGASVLWSFGGNTITGSQSLTSGEFNVSNDGVNYTQMQQDRFQASNASSQTAYKTASIEYVDFSTGKGQYIYFSPAIGVNKAIYFPDASGTIALANSPNAGFILNQSFSAQPSSNFWINGSGKFYTDDNNYSTISGNGISLHGPGNVSVRHSTYAAALEAGGVTIYSDNTGATGYSGYGRNSFQYFNGTYQQIINFTNPTGQNSLYIPDKPGVHTFAFLDDLTSYAKLTGGNSFSNNQTVSTTSANQTALTLKDQNSTKFNFSFGSGGYSYFDLSGNSAIRFGTNGSQLINTSSSFILNSGENFTFNSNNNTVWTVPLSTNRLTTPQITISNAPTTGTDAMRFGDNLPYSQINNVPANTILVNNTNSTAAATTIKYFDSGEQSYTDSVTWTGTTPPSGSPTSSYRWTQVGKLVNVRVTLVYPTAGSGITEVDAKMPEDVPTPLPPTSFSTADSSYTGWGGFSTSKSSPIVQAGNISLNVQSGIWKFKCIATSTNTLITHLNFVYYTP